MVGKVNLENPADSVSWGCQSFQLFFLGLSMTNNKVF